MKTEELKKFIITLLEDKFDLINNSIQNLSQELYDLKNRIDSMEEKEKQNLRAYQDRFKNFEDEFRRFQEQIKGANINIQRIEQRIIESNSQQSPFSSEYNRQISGSSSEASQQTIQQNPPRQQQPSQQTFSQNSNIYYQSTQSTQSQQQQFQPSHNFQQNSWIQEQPIFGQMVYKTVNGKKFHKDGCEWLKSSQIPIQRQQAMKDGLEACLVCKP